MNRKILIILVIILLAVFIILIIPKPIDQTGYQTDVLAENLNTPWAMDFLPNDTMIFTQRGGDVSVLDNNGVKSIGKINVTENGESGLLGVAVDPQFSQNRYVYLYYTYDSGNRVSRFVLNDVLENETVIIDNIPSSSIHDGGRIKFGPDGKLYVTTGDASNRTSAQDINSLSGKILRINKDGSVPSDNPFNNYVYSYGHRNPQGLAWNSNGILYASEHGQTQNDEINIITSGGNYGWPNYEGNNSAPGYQTPLSVYTEFTLAPSGMAFLNNKLYVAGLRGLQLRKISLSDNGTSITGQEPLFTQLGRIRDAVEHKGYIYICTCNRDGRGVPQINDDKIIRINVN
ncbi:MAG TPA: PQQ-dependent sugar dehydrogenase [Methanobacterium sp.]|nr:PQQ-dependent sugar dehydrogenase [Methanobacterium sp.]